MGHTLFGYNIIDGKAVVDEQKAEQLRTMFKSYLLGQGLINSAKSAGIDCSHGSVGILLKNKKYLGTSFYPQIIDLELFEKVKAERNKRAEQLGRTNISNKKEQETLPSKFHIKKSTKKFKDPYLKAQYLYSLIESEE